jgi:chromosome segregation ATPase
LADEVVPWGWNRKDGVIVLAMLAGLGSGWKIIDGHSGRDDREMGELTTQVATLQRSIDAINRALEAYQSDRMKMGASRAELDAINGKLVDLRGALDGVEKRDHDADAEMKQLFQQRIADLKQDMQDLGTQVRDALRAPLVGPRQR